MQLFGMKEARFIDICNCGRNKENSNIDPIGGFSNYAVIGVKQDRDQAKSQKNSP